MGKSIKTQTGTVAEPLSARQCAAVFSDIAQRSKAIGYMSRLAFQEDAMSEELDAITCAIESMARHNALIADHVCALLCGNAASLAGGDVEFWMMPPAYRRNDDAGDTAQMSGRV
jgi:hypothetical protein